MPRSSKLSKTSPSVLGLALVITLVAATLPWAHEKSQAATNVEISISEFGRYVQQWSEEEGYFDSDNFISNETSYLHVIDQLEKQVKPGGIYLGVGPDQNFSYIVHTHPMLAVITDIRRQNMLEHLWYKAIFAMSSNRLEFLCNLASREIPRTKPGTSLEQI